MQADAQRSPPEESIEALAQTLSAWRYEATEIEAAAWRQIMIATPVDRFKAYLSQHLLAGNGFPPKPSDAARALQLVVDPDAAYVQLERLVREGGPYAEPAIDDAVMVQAILLMGGWVTLNEQMPDPQNTFAVKAFRERWTACFNQAVSAVRIRGEVPTQPLLSLSTKRLASRQLAAPQRAAQLSSSGEAELPAPSRSQRFGVPPQ